MPGPSQQNGSEEAPIEHGPCKDGHLASCTWRWGSAVRVNWFTLTADWSALTAVGSALRVNWFTLTAAG